MQNSNIERMTINAGTGRFSHRIGSTLFTVNVYSKEDATETFEKKVFRLMKNDLESRKSYVNMGMPQADWLPGRSSV